MDRRQFLEAVAALAALAAGSSPTRTNATVHPTRPRRRADRSPGTPRLAIIDRFGRDVSAHGIRLVDWDGYLANPYIELNLAGPASGLRYPLSVEIRALGTSRLMMDLPSRLTAEGAVKQVSLTDASSRATFRLAIHPRRTPGPNELHRCELHVSDANGVTLVQPTPILVRVDAAKGSPSPIPLVFDGRFDTITGLFDDTPVRAASEAAITDWYANFDLAPFDQVTAGAESLSLPGNDWLDPVTVTNNAAYTGMWVFLRGLAEPYSTGFPADNGSFHTRAGRTTPYHRSTALILQFAKDASLFTSTADEDWWKTDLNQYVDVYGLAMHEYGHALAYNSSWAGMAAYHDGGWRSATSVIDYQGRAVPLDDSYHIPGDAPYWDRLSGQSGGWTHLFPTRRWMPTKLSLLIAESAGWKLDRTRTPFVKPSIVTESLPAGDRGRRYRAQLQARGGVPFYDWTIADGRLPVGCSLNRFSGLISGTPRERGTFRVEVQLHDYDAREQAVRQTFTLTVD